MGGPTSVAAYLAALPEAEPARPLRPAVDLTVPQLDGRGRLRTGPLEEHLQDGSPTPHHLSRGQLPTNVGMQLQPQRVSIPVARRLQDTTDGVVRPPGVAAG